MLEVAIHAPSVERSETDEILVVFEVSVRVSKDPYYTDIEIFDRSNHHIDTEVRHETPSSSSAFYVFQRVVQRVS